MHAGESPKKEGPRRGLKSDSGQTPVSDGANDGNEQSRALTAPVAMRPARKPSIIVRPVLLTNRDRIVDAIRAGAWSTADIARKVGMDSRAVGVELYWMRDQGRVASEHSRRARAVCAGRPMLRWTINEDWTPRRIGVPVWVGKPHRRIYREIARVLDEETAAQWARKAKAMAVPVRMISADRGILRNPASKALTVRADLPISSPISA